ncbi:MAG: S8 family serine peptidase [Betaproteobacteria bacterium]
MLFVLLGTISAGSATPSDISFGARDDTVYREIILVLDPRASPPSAVEIVAGKAADAAAKPFFALLSNAESLRLAFAGRLLSDDQAIDLRAKDKFAPELLAAENIVARFPVGADVDAQLQRLLASPLVFAAMRNFQVEYTSVPADPYFQVNLAGNPNNFPVTLGPNIWGKYQWGMTLLRFPQAWDKIRGNAYLADLNTGVYWQGGATHADLQASLRPQFSSWMVFRNPVGVYLPDPNFDEGQIVAQSGGSKTTMGHGTHVAGILAATPNNLTGVAGGCWSCSLMAIGTFTSADSIGAALFAAINRGAQVVNMSFATDPTNSENIFQSDTFCQTGNNSALAPCNAIVTAQNREVVLVASSGNATYHVQFPANQAGVMAVGGLEYLTQAPGSQFWVTGYGTIQATPPGDPCTTTTAPGVDSGSNCGPTQFLVAPAKDVVSTTYSGSDWSYPVYCTDQGEPFRKGGRPDESPNSDPGWTEYLPTGYGDCTGTSMSAPHVSALAGLMRSANPLLKASDIRRLMQRYASGNDTWLGNQLGYGVPIADGAVISVLSGASAANPTLYNSAVRNSLTPLFSLYSLQARNHFYTVAPQMAVVAYNGTLIPSPRYRMNSASYSASCGDCSILGQPVSTSPLIQVLRPDGTLAGANIAAHVHATSGPIGPVERYSRSKPDSTVDTNMSWGAGTNLSATLTANPMEDFVLTYAPVGSLVPNYGQFPSIETLFVYPRSSVSVYVAHVNPTGSGPDLIPLYRLSWRCGDSAKVICDNPAAPGYNPFHISHLYAAGDTEKANALAAGYKLDGIEGYVFPKSYGSAPQTGMVRLCRLYDPTRDEEILFPGTGNSGNKCNPPFPSYSGGSYYSSTIYSTDWMGWVYANYNGATPPTVNLTSPANNATFAAGSNISLTASASGSGVNNVKWYANGIQIASDNTSPYSKTWSSVPAGTYTVYAVANTGTELSATSAPANITVGSAPPVLGNNGFETPSVGSGPSAYVYGPTGASWTFTPAGGSGGSGVSGNGSNFTLGNPNAPYGQQVGFIQGATTISQTVNFAGAGSYHLTTYAAQRSSNQNGIAMTVNVLVDGISAGAMTPYDPYYQYQLNSSSAFSVTAGSHTITLQGVNPNGYDLTVFFDNVLITSP